jgi:hypothetical protein
MIYKELISIDGELRFNQFLTRLNVGLKKFKIREFKMIDAE